MSYTLAQLAEDIGSKLRGSTASEVQADLCRFVQKALRDQDFLAANIDPDQATPRKVIYEDKELGFCICSHVYNGPAASPAHDHGTSWAIYGQAEGDTEMTDWQIVKQAQGEDRALVKPLRTYDLKPGDTHFYDVGAVHSPKRDGPTKLIRIEGANLEHIRRTPIEAVS